MGNLVALGRRQLFERSHSTRWGRTTHEFRIGRDLLEWSSSEKKKNSATGGKLRFQERRSPSVPLRTTGRLDPLFSNIFFSVFSFLEISKFVIWVKF